MVIALLGLAVFSTVGKKSKGEELNRREESLTIVRLAEETNDI